MDEQASQSSRLTRSMRIAQNLTELERRGIQLVDEGEKVQPTVISLKLLFPPPENLQNPVTEKPKSCVRESSRASMRLKSKFSPVFDTYEGDDLYTVRNHQ
jgi:hypothetical protein